MNKIARNLATLSLSILLVSCGGSDSSEKSVESKAVKEVKSETAAYTIDTDKSKVMWKGTMLGMYSHEGTLDFIEGKFTMTDGKLGDGSFVVDMKSINPTDDGYDPEAGKGPEVLVGHLSTDDFFNVEAFPTSKLSIVNGELILYIRDSKNPVKLKDFKFKEEGDLLEATGNVTFDRKKFDVAFDHPAKEMVLSDDVELQVSIVAFKD
jgi:polyisoprenoid-binding protein YceI